MTTAPTRPPRQRRADQHHTDQTPTKMRAARALVSAVALLMILFSAGYIAVNLGKGRSIISGTVMLVVAVALMVVAQQQWFYRWARSEGRIATVHPPSTPTVPVQRRRRRGAEKPEQPAVPTVMPHESLGVEFAYMVRFVRYLVAKGRTEVLHEINATYIETDWDDDVYDEDKTDYRCGVEMVRSFAMDLPGYNENVPFEKFLAGDFDTRNPAPFLAEIDMYAPVRDLEGTAAGAVAAYMLIYNTADIEPDLIKAVMQPWTRRGLPYRIGNAVYEAPPGSDGYRRKPARDAAPTPSRPGAPLVEPPAETLDQAVNAGMPPAAAMPPAPVPPPPAAPRRAAQQQPAAPAARPHVDQQDEVTEQDLLKAAELVVISQFGSTAMIQRKMRIGYLLACKVMDRLERYGIVGPLPEGGNARPVVPAPDELDDAIAFIREQLAEGR